VGIANQGVAGALTAEEQEARGLKPETRSLIVDEGRAPRRIASFQDLQVYQKSYELALEVHKLTSGFPDFERFELGRQLRTSAMSIAVNIAEGYGRRASTADFKRFLTMATGSFDEAKVWISFARDLGYFSPESAAALTSRFEEVGKMLYGLHRSWRS
jgi:four helix bundle protein